MQITRTIGGLKVHAVAGTSAVLFGFDLVRIDLGIGRDGT